MKRAITILAIFAFAGVFCVTVWAQTGTNDDSAKGSTAPQGPHTATNSNASGAGAVAGNPPSSATTGKSARKETAPDAAVSGEPGNPASHGPGSEGKMGSGTTSGIGGDKGGTAQ
jgi:hypothetical protein